jgi:hypothetical protein
MSKSPEINAETTTSERQGAEYGVGIQAKELTFVITQSEREKVAKRLNRRGISDVA